MKFKELKRSLWKRHGLWRYNPLHVTTSLLFFHNGRFLCKLRGLEYQDWNIEEQEDGSWRLFFKERNEITETMSFASEDEACNAFLHEIDY
jgi:hypothetical protein